MRDNSGLLPQAAPQKTLFYPPVHYGTHTSRAKICIHPYYSRLGCLAISNIPAQYAHVSANAKTPMGRRALYNIQ